MSGWFQSFRDAVLVVAAALNLGSNLVCYESEDGPIGCFSNAWPFNNALGRLPQSPADIQATFRLYTRTTVASNEAPVIIRPNADSLAGSDFQGSRPTKMIIHGYRDTAIGSGTWIDTMALAMLAKDDVNVIAVDWSPGALQIVYSLAAANTRVVGALIAQLISALVEHKGANVADMHLIGHSLGSHIAGYAGAATPGMGRITGMDPAGLRFEFRNTTVRLDPTDAQFVDVIHTNGRPITTLGFGSRVSMGHVDFFPNGGSQQPGCNPNNEDMEEAMENGASGSQPPKVILTDKDQEDQWLQLGAINVFTYEKSYRTDKQLCLISKHCGRVLLVSEAVTCSHSRAYHFFTESISDTCLFMGSRCESYEQYHAGQCPCATSPCIAMGYHTPADAPRGDYYLTTNSQSPYCISQPSAP